MAQEDVTISLSSDVAATLRMRANTEGRSVSDVVEATLRDRFSQSDETGGRRSHRLRDLMKAGLPLDLGDRVPWTREELHEQT